MKKFLRKFREFFVSFGMIGLFSALLFFGVARVWERNQEKMIAIQQAKIDRKMLEEQRNEIVKMREEAERIRSTNERLSVFLPKDHVISLVEKVESIGKDFSVSIVSEASPVSAIAFPAKKKSTKKAPASEEVAAEGKESETKQKEEKREESLVSLLTEERSVFITFQATGAYQDVIAFLQKLDTMPVLLDVLSLEIAPEESEKKERQSIVSTPIQISAGNPFETKKIPSETIPKEEPNRVSASFHTVIYLSS